MKRDMDLARKILFEIENQPYTERYFDVRIDGADRDEVQYHVALLAEAGLIEAENKGYDQADRWMALRLTRRQQELAALVAEGLTNEQIAERLVLTPGTVANHVEHILGRLGLKNRTQLGVWATERGLYHSGWDNGTM